MADRYNLYTEEYTENGYDLTFFDIYSTNWADFDFTAGYTPHIITPEDTMKPYMIAYAHYKSMDYWEILLFINGVIDILDLKVADVIRVPDRQAFLTYVNSKKTVNQG